MQKSRSHSSLELKQVPVFSYIMCKIELVLTQAVLIGHFKLTLTKLRCNSSRDVIKDSNGWKRKFEPRSLGIEVRDATTWPTANCPRSSMKSSQKLFATGIYQQLPEVGGMVVAFAHLNQQPWVRILTLPKFSGLKFRMQYSGSGSSWPGINRIQKRTLHRPSNSLPFQ